MNNLEKKLKKTLIFLFPWRDALGVTLAGIPLRFGEIGAVLLGIIPLFNGGRIKLKRKESFIIWILIINLFITLLGYIKYQNSIDTSFGLKYIVRNVLYIVTILGFLSSKISFSSEDVDRLFDFFTVLQLVAFVLVLTTGLHMYMGTIWGKERMIAMGQFVNLAGLTLPRFAGTCSESGYLAPLFTITSYYYLKEYMSVNGSKKKKHSLLFLMLTLVMTLFTFSTAVYLFVGLTLSITFLKNSQRKKAMNVLLIAAIFVLGLLLFIATNETVQQYLSNEIFNKIAVYLSLGNKTDIFNWSAMDRSQHIENAINLFKSSNPLQILIGHGTGAYSDYASRQTTLLVTDVNEAYNLFLSTLTDRGILGFTCLIVVFIYCKKYWIKRDIYSTALFVGVVSQFLHWMLTGNFWLYYFWYEIIFLVGYSRHNKSMQIMRH